MVKSQNIVLLVGLICLLSLGCVAYAANTQKFRVHGMIYCDTCRIQFITRVSTMIQGATVRLECRNITTSQETYKAEAVTDKKGLYSIPVEGDYEDDICQIVLVKNPTDCNEIPTDAFSQLAATISLTSNNGEASPVRYANPLGFMKKDPLPECPEVLKELDLFNNNGGAPPS